MSVPHLKAPSLARYSFHVRHGFFGCEGGASQGPYATLNASARSDDKPEHVATNQARIIASLTGGEGTMLTPWQEHTSKALYVEQADSKQLHQEAADALITRKPGLVLGIMCADCAPILICEPSVGVIAAIHAGWRGSLGGIIESALDVMNTCGADLNHAIAAIGPSLGADSFEVGPEFVDRFSKAFAWSEPLFRPGNEDRFLFDHTGFIQHKLTYAGISLVESLPIDTLTNEQYFSYRRSQKAGQSDYGRNASAIMLLE